MSASAASGTSKPSPSEMVRKRAIRSSMPMRWKSKRWQRERIVSGTLWGCVVASTNTTRGGGSSSVLSSALNAEAESM